MGRTPCAYRRRAGWGSRSQRLGVPGGGTGDPKWDEGQSERTDGPNTETPVGERAERREASRCGEQGPVLQREAPPPTSRLPASAGLPHRWGTPTESPTGATRALSQPGLVGEMPAVPPPPPKEILKAGDGMRSQGPHVSGSLGGRGCAPWDTCALVSRDRERRQPIPVEASGHGEEAAEADTQRWGRNPSLFSRDAEGSCWQLSLDRREGTAGPQFGEGIHRAPSWKGPFSRCSVTVYYSSEPSLTLADSAGVSWRQWLTPSSPRTRTRSLTVPCLPPRWASRPSTWQGQGGRASARRLTSSGLRGAGLPGQVGQPQDGPRKTHVPQVTTDFCAQDWSVTHRWACVAVTVVNKVMASAFSPFTASLRKDGGRSPYSSGLQSCLGASRTLSPTSVFRHSRESAMRTLREKETLF